MLDTLLYQPSHSFCISPSFLLFISINQLSQSSLFTLSFPYSLQSLEGRIHLAWCLHSISCLLQCQLYVRCSVSFHGKLVGAGNVREPFCVQLPLLTLPLPYLNLRFQPPERKAQANHAFLSSSAPFENHRVGRACSWRKCSPGCFSIL